MGRAGQAGRVRDAGGQKEGSPTHLVLGLGLGRLKGAGQDGQLHVLKLLGHLHGVGEQGGARGHSQCEKSQ